MNKKIKELIEAEEYGLERAKEDLKKLKSKWFTISSTKDFISFLEYYIKEKEKLIKNFKKK